MTGAASFLNNLPREILQEEGRRKEGQMEDRKWGGGAGGRKGRGDLRIQPRGWGGSSSRSFSPPSPML